MDTETAVTLFLSTAEDNWIWLSAALLLGVVVGWISYAPGSRSRAAGR
jgi:hypothetical protein